MNAAVSWTRVIDYEDIRYEHSGTGIARVMIDRPEVHNAFRPETVQELIDAFARIRDDASIGCRFLMSGNFTDAQVVEESGDYIRVSFTRASFQMAHT